MNSQTEWAMYVGFFVGILLGAAVSIFLLNIK